jgi:general secretion pathway protein I
VVTRPRGFTLLEVMVAVAILGLALTVILSAQAGLYTSSGYAQRLSVATGLARCRMSELEERLMKLGFPYSDETDEGACCADELRTDYRCSWKVELVELPQPRLDSGVDGGAGGLSAALSSAGASAGLPPAGGAPTSGGDGVATLMQLATNPGAVLGDGGISGLSGALPGGGLGGTDMIAPLVMGFVYPQLKPMLEASIRKVTVTVRWREGLRSRDLELQQYLTNPMKVSFLPGLAGSAMPGGSLLPAAGAAGTSTTRSVK